jgi:RNA polymerase sigma-70 factor (ECF subfamily)
MTELQLIQQSQSGDTSCFSQLVKLYEERLYHYLLARCYSSYDAEDVLQDTFISAYKYIHGYKIKWKFSTWLFTIANRLIKKQHKSYYSNNEYLDIRDDSEQLFSSIFDRNNIWIEIKNVLKADAFDVLWFYYIEELTIKEITQVLKHSQSWVKISLYRSKKKLAKNKKIQFLSRDYFLQGIIL